MSVIFQCPKCQKRSFAAPQPPDSAIACTQCDWTRDEGSADYTDGFLVRCRICGCDDLWRQKDFPPALGLFFVALGAGLSTLAWAWHYPGTALGILMVFALADLLLYTFMGDMLVCYRCRARHRKTPLHEEYPAFSLELNERYVQMHKRTESGVNGH